MFTTQADRVGTFDARRSAYARKGLTVEVEEFGWRECRHPI